MQKKDDRILYYKNNNNLKLTRTLNKWIELAQGKYIARIDDDDIRCDREKLSKQVNFMETHLEYGLCGTNIILEDTITNKQTSTSLHGWKW